MFSRVSAQVLETDTTLKSYPLETRKCRFQEETIFDTDNMITKSDEEICCTENAWTLLFASRYSSSNCQFECSLKELVSLYGCLPWDVPGNFVDGETLLCRGDVAVEFKHSLKTKVSEACTESCRPPLCNGVTYISKVAYDLSVFFCYSTLNSFSSLADIYYCKMVVVFLGPILYMHVFLSSSHSITIFRAGSSQDFSTRTSFKSASLTPTRFESANQSFELT